MSRSRIRRSRFMVAITFLVASLAIVGITNVQAAPKATIVSVTSSTPDGTYKVGDKISIIVTFSEPVTTEGWVAILLETGPSDRVARVESSFQRTATTIELFYTVKPGDRSADLDVQSKFSFLLGDAEIGVNGEPADLTLPSPGSPASLGVNSNIVVDGSDADEQWANPFDSVKGLHGIVLNEDLRENVSFLGLPGSQGSYCASTTDSVCAGKDVHFRAVLPRCTTDAQLDCIDSVTALANDGEARTGEFSEVFPKKGTLDFVGSSSLKIPSGTTTSIYKFKEFPHTVIAGKSYDEYAVTLSMGGSNLADGSVQSRTIFASITPVMFRDVVCDERYNGQCKDGSARQENSGVAIDMDFGFRCILWDAVDGNGDGKIQMTDTPSDKTMCALKRPFPPGVRFTLKARLSSEPGGWLHGRMDNPTILFESTKAKSLVTISAAPVKVPAFAGVAPYDHLPTGIRSYFDAICASSCHSARFGPQPSNISTAKRSLLLSPKPFSTTAFSEFALWKDFLSDTASALPSQWNVRTLDKSEMQSASSCIASGSGVKGIVTTNATAYIEGPPSFDSTSKTLKYEVAAPHYEKDGKTEFKGVYNLIVREDIAECMYGFSNAFAAPAPPEEFADEADPDVYVEEEPYVDEAVYAEEYPDFGAEFMDTDDGSYEMFEDVEYEEVSLEDYIKEEEDFTLTEDLSDAGDVIEEEEVFEETVVASIDASIITELQKAATANTSIELADGWFKFSATNFTFSKPTVKVNFAATPAKVVACIAGSTIRYVKAIRTQCPAGSSVAKTVYCVKGKTVDAVVGAKPKCAKGFKVGKSLKCAKGDDARLVVALVPKCSKGWSTVKTYVCVKGNVARKVSAVQVKCANGFVLAKQLTCIKGKAVTTVTAVKPSCPKGFRARK